MDRLEQYRIFMQVSESRSFTRAAAALNLPRATVSTAVQQLEQVLGTRLLHRTTRQVSLSADGVRLLERLRPLLEEAEALEQLFQPEQRSVAGHLRIDVPSRVARKLVAPALPELLRRYPGLSLTLGSSDRSINLAEDGVDCVVRIGPVEDSSLVARPLGAVAMVNCAHPAYLQHHGVPLEPNDLLQHWAIGYQSATGKTASWDYLDAQGRSHSLTLPCRVTVNNAETYLACCRAGLGLIQVPRYDVAALLACGELKEVLPDWLPAPMPVTVLYPHRRQRSRRLSLFIAWMQELLRPHLHAPG